MDNRNLDMIGGGLRTGETNAIWPAQDASTQFLLTGGLAAVETWQSSGPSHETPRYAQNTETAPRGVERRTDPIHPVWRRGSEPWGDLAFPIRPTLSGRRTGAPSSTPSFDSTGVPGPVPGSICAPRCCQLRPPSAGWGALQSYLCAAAARSSDSVQPLSSPVGSGAMRAGASFWCRRTSAECFPRVRVGITARCLWQDRRRRSHSRSSGGAVCCTVRRPRSGRTVASIPRTRCCDRRTRGPARAPR